MSNFITMVNRVATELRRSNIDPQIKLAINDAIEEAAKTRFYLNEVRALTFNTVVGQEYYPDMGMVEIDTLYYVQGGTRYNLTPESNIQADIRADGNQVNGQLELYAREGTDLRLYPLPSTILPVYMDGYGKLTPWPLVGDTDTNNWMTYGAQYIRALAKRNVLRDVVKDYAEAATFDAIADDYKNDLLGETTLRLGTGTVRSTCF